MAWLARNADKRCAPDQVLPDCRSVIALAVATLWAGTAAAQTVLKFSHTDQPGGARQKAAEDERAAAEAEAESSTRRMPVPPPAPGQPGTAGA